MLSSGTRTRMMGLADQPFRKIRVRDHLLGGFEIKKPSILHCLTASRIVADELTVRLSRRCDEIGKLPYGAAALPFATTVIDWYTQTCRELFKFSDEVEKMRHILPETQAKPSSVFGFNSIFEGGSGHFTNVNVDKKDLAPPEEDIKNIVFGTECKDPMLISRASELVSRLMLILERAVSRHKPLMLLTARELAKLSKTLPLEEDKVQHFLNRFHHQRIAVRLLIGHCVALHKPLPLPNMIGIFCTKTPIEDIVLESVALAEEMCLASYGCVPEIELSCWTEPSVKNPDSILYIPSHLQHMIFELVKNSMRAVIEKEQMRLGLSKDAVVQTIALPPINVHWDITDDNVIFSVRDKGLGISSQFLERVFLFHYSTAPPPLNVGAAPIMAGFGYGLSLSRIYARFLKGDMWLESEEGVGTCVYIKCKRKWDLDELI